MSSSPSPPSTLLVQEFFDAEDERFLGALVQIHSPTFLAGFVQKWLADPRPWAREQLYHYTRLDWNLPGHELVVKRLFKHYEAAADHDMLAHFLVAFDRLVRRNRRGNYHYNYQTRSYTRDEKLVAPSNKTVIPGLSRQATYTDWRGRTQTYSLPPTQNHPRNRLFSNETRYHLRRRAWRYFRRLSYQKPAAYLAAITSAMIEYRDGDFALGENILDNWSLMHAAYYHHPAISFTADHTNLVAGQSLGDLSAAPYQPLAWKTKKGEENLLELLLKANSGLIRIWAMELLRRDHAEAIQDWDVPTLIHLINSRDPRVQEFAAEMFEQHPGLGTLDIETWLQLLEHSDQGVLTLLCDAIRKHVQPERLTNAQMLELATARPVPVARLGFQFLQNRHKLKPFHTSELAQLANVQCESLAQEIASWALARLCEREQYDLEYVIEFFDSLQEGCRSAAMETLADAESPVYSDPVLWSRLIETPFDDVRLGVVESLQEREREAKNGISVNTAAGVAALWVTVILGVHRGGRAKLKAIQQVAGAIARDASLRDSLLPVLGVAVRSLRGPERRTALSAVVTLAMQDEALRQAITRELPELYLPNLEATL